MSEPFWQTEHSIQTVAAREFAWTYMTDVMHWDDPPAKFQLDSPFVTAGLGTAETPGQPPRSCRLRDVQPLECYTIEFALSGTTLFRAWRIEDLPEKRARLTQRITLEGENATAYRAEVEQAFVPNLEPGMRRVATAIDRAYGGSY